MTAPKFTTRTPLAENIIRFRKQQGISQRRLAEALFTNVNIVERVEGGYGYPSMQTLKKMAAILNTTVSELVKGE